MRIKDNRKEISIFLIFVFPIILILIWRIMRGFDWSDEAYYSAIVYRIIQGDALFQTSWDIHQLSAVLLVPVYWLYIKICGTKGIILFSRIVFILFLAGEATGIYIKFRKRSGSNFCILASIALLSYECLYGLSYNTMMIEAFILAILCLPDKHIKQYRLLRYFISGFFSGIAVQSYPSMVIVLPLFLFYCLSNRDEEKIKNITYYIFGGVVVLVLFCVFLIINSSFSALINNIQYMFMDPEHTGNSFSIWIHIKSIFKLISREAVFAFAFAFIFAIMAWRTNTKIQGTLHICLYISILFALYFQWHKIKNEYGNGFIHYQLYFSISCCFPIVWLLNRCRWNNLILLFLGGGIGSIGVNVLTNNDATIYIYPYIVSALVACNS